MTRISDTDEPNTVSNQVFRAGMILEFMRLEESLGMRDTILGLSLKEAAEWSDLVTRKYAECEWFTDDLAVEIGGDGPWPPAHIQTCGIGCIAYLALYGATHRDVFLEKWQALVDAERHRSIFEVLKHYLFE